MADNSKIGWTNATWNPTVGCSVVSRGCTNCYAMKQAARILRMDAGARPEAYEDGGTPSHYDGTVKCAKGGDGPVVWTGKVALAPERILTQPLRWKRPRRIFVNSMGDLFHESIPDAWIDRVFAVMALARHHTFQVLTKRSKRMHSYLDGFAAHVRIEGMLDETKPNTLWNGNALEAAATLGSGRPLPNVWLGVSAEDQERADERTPDLLATPAAVRFVSAEPLLGAIDFRRIAAGTIWRNALTGNRWNEAATLIEKPGLDWIIVGGESGPHARPMHPDWARTIRDQCAAAGVPFFFKQWGEWAPGEICGPNKRSMDAAHWFDRRWIYERAGPAHPDDHIDDEPTTFRIGKSAAGRLLEGVEHNAFPPIHMQGAADAA